MYSVVHCMRLRRRRHRGQYEKYSHLDFSCNFWFCWFELEIPVGIFHLSTLVVVRRIITRHSLLLSPLLFLYAIHVVVQ